jgi:hypothetical protein
VCVRVCVGGEGGGDRSKLRTDQRSRFVRESRFSDSQLCFYSHICYSSDLVVAEYQCEHQQLSSSCQDNCASRAINTHYTYTTLTTRDMYKGKAQKERSTSNVQNKGQNYRKQYKNNSDTPFKPAIRTQLTDIEHGEESFSLKNSKCHDAGNNSKRKNT